MNNHPSEWKWCVEEIARGEYWGETWVMYWDGERNRVVKEEAWYSLIKEIEYILRHASAEVCQEVGMTQEIAQGIAAACGRPDIEVAFGQEIRG